MLQWDHLFEELFFFVQGFEESGIFAGAHHVAYGSVDVPGKLCAEVFYNERGDGFRQCRAVVIVVVDLFTAGLQFGEAERAYGADVKLMIELFHAAIGVYHVVNKYR